LTRATEGRKNRRVKLDPATGGAGLTTVVCAACVGAPVRRRLV
jgi:hypothetical protein